MILEGECMSEAEYDNPCAFCGFASERTDSMGHDYLVCECDNPDDYPNEAVCNNEADKEF